MNRNKKHIAKGLFLLLLTLTVFLSSAGVYHSSVKTQKEITRKEKTSKSDPKEERVSASPNFEAVVVSFISPDFAKEILFTTFDFSPLVEKVILTSKRPVISEKYFRTLFTHFISPNAP